MSVIALILVAATVGAMLFFGAVVAPTAFRILGETGAGPFVRALFPRYYLAFAATSFGAAAASVAGGAVVSAVVLALAGTGFVYGRMSLMPAINRARHEGMTEVFERLHRRSVRLNMSQIVMLTGTMAGIPLGI